MTPGRPGWGGSSRGERRTIDLRAHDDLIVDLPACSTSSENVAAELSKYLTKDIDNCGRKIAPDVFAQVYGAFAGGEATQGSSGFMALAVRTARACPECDDTSPRQQDVQPNAERVLLHGTKTELALRTVPLWARGTS